jgi:hypothetical protein
MQACEVTLESTELCRYSRSPRREKTGCAGLRGCRAGRCWAAGQRMARWPGKAGGELLGSVWRGGQARQTAVAVLDRRSAVINF